MSQYETQGAGEPAPGVQGVLLIRYTLYVPVRDNNRKEIPHILGGLRQWLTDNGIPNRSVIRRVQGDWQGDNTYYETEENDLVIIDGSEEIRDLIMQAAQWVKDQVEQEAVYVTEQAITTYLV